MRLYLAFLVAVGVERVLELIRSKRHARLALASGGVEHGRGHYPVMVLVHALFLPACALEAWLLHRRPPGGWAYVFVAGALLAQGLRYWAVHTLGERWTTRVVVVPGAPPITRGPYRFLKHPNYLAVTLEMACIPLIYGCWWTAVAFSLANAALLGVRIGVEERALGGSWARAFARRRRFVPGLPARP